MAVVSWKTLEVYTSSLKSLAEKFFDRTPLTLSGDEFVAAFIHPDHIEKLREVQALVGFVGSSSCSSTLATSDGQTATVGVSFYGSSPVILPQYVKRGLQPTCPQPVHDKIMAWIDDRVKFGTAFGDAIDAIGYLNDTCGDLRAMSIMLPCLATVMGQVSDDADNKTVKRARKLSSQRSFGALPKMPLATKQRLVEVSALVNSVTLVLDATPPEMQRGDARFFGGALEFGRQSGLFRSQGTYV